MNNCIAIHCDRRHVPICACDFNFDWDFHAKKGNKAFRIFMQDNVWVCAKPSQLVDTNWADRGGDGKDDYPDSQTADSPTSVHTTAQVPGRGLVSINGEHQAAGGGSETTTR